MLDGRFKRHVALTVLVQALSLLSFFLLLVIVLPRYISKEDVGLYITFRALLLIFYPLFSFALDIAQARYLGYYGNHSESTRQVTGSTLALFMGATFAASILLLLFRSFLVARFLDGDQNLFWALWTGLFLIGLFRVVYAYYQGLGRMNMANTIQAIVSVVGTLLIVVLLMIGSLHDIRHILWVIALLPGISILPFFVILFRTGLSCSRVREVLVYAAPRVPHVLITGFFMSAPIILAKYFYDNSLASDIGIGTRFFQVIETIAYAFNMVLLPGVSGFWRNKKMEELENALSSYFDKVTHAGFALMFGFYAVGPLFITWFLPAAYANAIPVLNVISFAVVPYLIYAMSRSIIHGIDHRPIHLLIDGLTILTLTCSFFFLRWMYPFKPFAMITLSFLAACVMAGAGSYLYILQRVHVEMNMKWLACHGFLILLLILSSTQWLIVSIALFLLLELVVLVRIFRGEFSAVERQR